MKVDMRIHSTVRDQVHAGISALRVQGRQIWGDTRHDFPEVLSRLTVGVGDLARLARDVYEGPPGEEDHERWRKEIQKELGNVLFSTIRWIDDLGFDVLECLDRAIEAQEKYAQSGRRR